MPKVKVGEIRFKDQSLMNDMRRWEKAVRSPRRRDLLNIERAMRRGPDRAFRGDRVGVWPPLAEWTQSERARQGYGATGPMLRRSGEYWRSWVQRGGWTSFSRRARGWGLEVGSSLVEGGRRRVLEVGGRNPEGFMVPARPVRWMDAQAERTIHDAVDEMLFDRWRKIVRSSI
jgi:hypothetical protein